GVPYIDKTLNVDSPELLSPRIPRNELATKIMEDLDRALALLLPKSGVENFRVHRGVALAFKSEGGLFEGTLEKCHDGTRLGSPVNEITYLLTLAAYAAMTMFSL